MEIIKIVFLGLILIKSCSAVENKTKDLEQHIKIQKREKQYLVEDDPCDGPEQKREERQSIPEKPNQVELNAQPKNIRVQPKMMPTSPKPSLKSIVMQKPINHQLDGLLVSTPQKIPTKIPVTLKTAKVVPNAAHALRVKMIENLKNNSMPNKEMDLNTNNENICVTNKRDPISQYKEDNIPFTTENKVDLKKDDHEIPKMENQVIFDQKNKITLNKENPKFLTNEDAQVNLRKYEKKKDTSMPAETEEVNMKINPNPPIDIKRKYHLFIDEAEPITQVYKDQTKQKQEKVKTETKCAKNKEASPKRVNNKTKKDDHNQKDLIPDDQADNGLEVIQILNGTHLISIKKIGDYDKHNIQQFLSRDCFDEPKLIEERIINKKPLKHSNKLEKNPTACTQTKDNMVLDGIQFSDNKIKDDKVIKQNIQIKHSDSIENKEPNDCITIVNHDYEEIEERTPILPAVSTNTYDEGSQQFWYLPKNHQNLYYNPYQQNIYDQYRQNYVDTQNDANVQIQVNDNLYKNIPEYSQSYYQNETEPIYNNPYYTNQLDVVTSCAESRPENNLDRIWRTWKDVEIKIRNSQSNVEPIDIDIRKNTANSSSKVINNGFGKLPFPYVNQPIHNGYYINQNSAIYPYVNNRHVH